MNDDIALSAQELQQEMTASCAQCRENPYEAFRLMLPWASFLQQAFNASTVNACIDAARIADGKCPSSSTSILCWRNLIFAGNSNCLAVKFQISYSQVRHAGLYTQYLLQADHSTVRVAAACTAHSRLILDEAVLLTVTFA